MSGGILILHLVVVTGFLVVKNRIRACAVVATPACKVMLACFTTRCDAFWAAVMCIETHFTVLATHVYALRLSYSILPGLGIIHARGVPIVHMTRKSCDVKGLGHINHVSTRTIRLLTSKELSIGLIDLCCKSCDTKWLGDGQFLCS